MILIAVSGSAFTDWAFVEDGRVVDNVRTEGLNPFFQTRKEISRSIRLGMDEEYFHRKLEKIYFYGAGCSSEAKKKVVNQSLVSQFKTPAVVESDLLAAARGMCLDQEGLVCILDTGSNSCLYDGKEIVRNVKPCGYILGDEGSGAYLGRLFLSDMLKELAPKELSDEFYRRYNTSYQEVMTTVYNAPLPHYYLASVATFLAEYQSDEYVRNLVVSAFDAFMQRNVCQYNYLQYPISFTGSVAVAFHEILKEVCQKYNFKVQRIESSIIYGLITYHTTHQ